MDRAEKIQFGISFIIRLTLAAAAVASVFTQQWLNLFLIITAIFLTFLPAIIQRNYRVYLPIEVEFIIILFPYATLYLGEIKEFYLRFWWWDAFLHSLSGLMFGFIGFLIVYVLNSEAKVRLKMGPKFVALFSFTFALAIGAVWEMFEFMGDSFFGLNMQKSGLVDTMWDLILDSFGALIASVLGYFYIKKGGAFLFDRWLRKFIERNPKFFDAT